MKFTTIERYFPTIKAKFACKVLCIVLLLGSSLQVAAAPVLSYVVEGAGNAEIYCADTTGNVLRRIATDAPNMGSLSWSPDGRFVAYQSNHEGTPNIYVMDIRNKVSRRLTNHQGRSLRPVWSPNGKWIVFVSDRAGKYLDVYRMDTDGSNLRRLTNRGHNWRPTWSPDSQWIAFNATQDRRTALYIMTADGKGRRQLKQGVRTSAGCAWSPDAKQIAFAAGSEFENGLNIRVVDTDGNNQRRLTHVGGLSLATHPAWSPDGAWIAYSVKKIVKRPPPGVALPIDQIYSKCTIYVVNTIGKAGEPREIVNGLPLQPMPAWAPEGFLAVSPSAEKQTTLWGRLKQNRE